MITASPLASPPASAPESAAPEGWRAELRLSLGRRHDRTRVLARSHLGPLVIQRPFYPEPGGACHLYLVHPPGGIVGGDRLELSVDVNDAGHGVLTTPAATKLYRSNGATARLTQRFKVSRGAALEWLPQETIAFSGALSRLETHVELEAGASFIGWETLCLGRPACGEGFSAGQLSQRLQIVRDGTLLVSERLLLDGGGPALSERWGLAGHSTIATLVAVPGDSAGDIGRNGVELVEQVRAAVPEDAGLVGVSWLSGALLCRFLGDGTGPAQTVLRSAWRALRPVLLGCSAVPPRIWAT